MPWCRQRLGVQRRGGQNKAHEKRCNVAADDATKIEEEFKKVLPECLQIRMTTSTKMASSRFSTEPKSCAVLPPPKEFTPTEIKLRPMESTTSAGNDRGQQLAQRLQKEAQHCLKQATDQGRAMIAP